MRTLGAIALAMQIGLPKFKAPAIKSWHEGIDITIQANFIDHDPGTKPISIGYWRLTSMNEIKKMSAVDSADVHVKDGIRFKTYKL